MVCTVPTLITPSQLIDILLHNLISRGFTHSTVVKMRECIQCWHRMVKMLVLHNESLTLGINLPSY